MISASPAQDSSPRHERGTHWTHLGKLKYSSNRGYFTSNYTRAHAPASFQYRLQVYISCWSGSRISLRHAAVIAAAARRRRAACAVGGARGGGRRSPARTEGIRHEAAHERRTLYAKVARTHSLTKKPYKAPHAHPFPCFVLPTVTPLQQYITVDGGPRSCLGHRRVRWRTWPVCTYRRPPVGRCTSKEDNLNRYKVRAELATETFIVLCLWDHWRPAASTTRAALECARHAAAPTRKNANRSKILLPYGIKKKS
ncbi:hypothetical protein EVAR_9835_1 [Eumeta japonica]|uniref:Uncharacterized protein n=1 Tax=Eumeta variegata TaxID=151549 RepID=A0A4C2AA81_EUMVA|nr:hypothetical protein EVAR_9835_1 [Eumeta japonica]